MNRLLYALDRCGHREETLIVFMYMAECCPIAADCHPSLTVEQWPKEYKVWYFLTDHPLSIRNDGQRDWHGGCMDSKIASEPHAYHQLCRLVRIGFTWTPM
jgi:hypothetical protein